jgi:hypothetical protein
MRRDIVGRFGRIAIFVVMAGLGGTARGDFMYANFSSPTGLNLVGSAVQAGSNIDLTANSGNQAGAIWRTDLQPVAGGWTAQWTFTITQRGGAQTLTTPPIEAGADGVVLVIQNVNATQLGGAGGSIGYGGITNSVAVEYDTFFNTNYTFGGSTVLTGNGDTNGNHVAVHSNGTAANSDASTARRGEAVMNVNVEDGAVHTGKVTYVTSPSPALQLFLDNTLLTTVPFNISTELNLTGGQAFVGLTSATGTAFERHTLQSFSFAAVPEAGVGVVLVGVGVGVMGRRRRDRSVHYYYEGDGPREAHRQFR